LVHRRGHAQLADTAAPKADGRHQQQDCAKREIPLFDMRRRDFIIFFGGAAAAWPLAAGAQQPAMPVVGYLSGLSRTATPAYLAAFQQGLDAAGYVQGRTVAIEYRWAEGRYDRLPALADDLVRRQVAVIAATGGTAAVLAAKAATAAIPIVFNTGGDPVKLGLVASLNRPGGNVTGVCWLNNTTAPKRLELLRGLLPSAATIGFLRNPANPNAAAETLDVQTAAHALGQQIQVENAANEREIDTAFAGFARARVDALFVAADPLFTDRRDQVNSLAARHAIPASYVSRINVVAGGLMSYGADYTDAYRQSGLYTGRILKGEKPADLPVQQSVKFELVINLTTAKALGLTVPDKLLALADEVIE
jgi:putative ABC transport system substrate-binding protein